MIDLRIKVTNEMIKKLKKVIAQLDSKQIGCQIDSLPYRYSKPYMPITKI